MMGFTHTSCLCGSSWTLLAGHCSEKDHDPPRGLQLILGTKNIPHLVDTLVMANLGYWQMKVSPGVWYLQLAPGRSANLYTLKENGDGNQRLSPSKQITINDLRGKVVHLEVVKKKGKEHEQLLVVSVDDNRQLEKEKVFPLSSFLIELRLVIYFLPTPYNLYKASMMLTAYTHILS